MDAYLHEFAEGVFVGPYETGEWREDNLRASAIAGSLNATMRRAAVAGYVKTLEARFPHLASVITAERRNRNPAGKWLRLALTGSRDWIVDAIAQHTGQPTERVSRAVNAAAWRVCRNELPRRFRADLELTTSSAA
jgi:hypothetical protein